MKGYIGFRVRILESQVEKNTEHETETGVIRLQQLVLAHR